jgi:hypothetical protein
MGKSWITVAFVLWLLLLNPQLKILVVSANEKLAKDFTKFARDLIDGMEILQHLRPKSGQQDNAMAFTVGPATSSKDPSVKSAGITGQITGNRADVIVPDDIEVPKNSHTHVLREWLAELVKEFDAVLSPGGRILYLGTPQNESSVYMKLLGRGYTMRIWPVRIPEKPEQYAGRLAPFIQNMIDRGTPPDTPIEPNRFGTVDILERYASYGASGFALQFMLDTNPSDAEKHPLKTRDLVIHDVDRDLGHVKIIWDSSEMIEGLYSGGFDGDYYTRPGWRSQEMVPYQGTVMAIDPSGKGGDETAFAIVRYLNGMLYLVDVGGFTDGFAEKTLRQLATRMILHRTNYWFAEENYGGGMFAQLLKPVILQVAAEMRADESMPEAAGASFDEEYNAWSSTQKELRIIDTLQPILNGHRLVVDRRVIEADLKQQHDNERFSLIQQMTRISRIRGCLPNEDRLETVAMACGYWTKRMARDKDKALEDHKNSLLDDELKKFLKHVVGHSPVPRTSVHSFIPARR